MATLGGVLIHVSSESPSYGVDITSHPVETGDNVSDHVKKEQTTFSINGIMVGDNAESEKDRLINAMNIGRGLFYNGVQKMQNVLIESIDLDYSKDIKNGFSISINMREFRTVSAQVIQPLAAKPVVNQGTKQTATKQPATATTEKFVTVRKGDTLSKYANIYGTSVTNLKKLNPSVVPTKMQIGSKVRVA